MFNAKANFSLHTFIKIYIIFKGRQFSCRWIFHIIFFFFGKWIWIYYKIYVFQAGCVLNAFISQKTSFLYYKYTHQFLIIGEWSFKTQFSSLSFWYININLKVILENQDYVFRFGRFGFEVEINEWIRNVLSYPIDKSSSIQCRCLVPITEYNSISQIFFFLFISFYWPVNIFDWG